MIGKMEILHINPIRLREVSAGFSMKVISSILFPFFSIVLIIKELYLSRNLAGLWLRFVEERKEV